jgi:DnaJ-class molecular chaperone
VSRYTLLKEEPSQDDEENIFETFEKEEKIVLCDRCNGSGKIEMDETVDYHNNIKDYWDVGCSKCGGAGRLVEKTIIKTRKLNKQELKIRGREE